MYSTIDWPTSKQGIIDHRKRVESELRVDQCHRMRYLSLPLLADKDLSEPPYSLLYHLLSLSQEARQLLSRLWLIARFKFASRSHCRKYTSTTCKQGEHGRILSLLGRNLVHPGRDTRGRDDIRRRLWFQAVQPVKKLRYHFQSILLVSLQPVARIRASLLYIRVILILEVLLLERKGVVEKEVRSVFEGIRDGVLRKVLV